MIIQEKNPKCSRNWNCLNWRDGYSTKQRLTDFSFGKRSCSPTFRAGVFMITKMSKLRTGEWPNEGKGDTAEVLDT